MVEPKSKKWAYFTAFIIPCLVLYILFFITPFFRGIGISFTNWDGLTQKTPISLNKSDFETKVLGKLKNKKDIEYINNIYHYDESDEAYKRLSVKGFQRSRLEKIFRKTDYVAEYNRFVGFDNYKKIFSGNVDPDFYPHSTIVEKYTASASLPIAISKTEFEKEVIKGAEKNNVDIELLKKAYVYDHASVSYKLESEYKSYEFEDKLYDMEEVEKNLIPVRDIEKYVSEVKGFCDSEKYEDALNSCINFVHSHKLSRVSNETLSDATLNLITIGKLENMLSKAWIVKQYNMGVVGFTFFFAIFSVIGINVLAFALALALDTGIRGQKVLRTVFFLPNVLSMIIVALIWSMLFVQLLPALTGIEKWISDSHKTPWLLVLVAVWQGAGYYMIVYLAGLQNIPTEVIEAAKIDGATGWQRFKFVTLPLMIPSLTISLFLTIANALKSFDLVYALIGQTGYATGTVPFVMDIYFDAFSLKQAGLSTAKAMVLFFVIVIITGIQLFTMKRKEVEA